ncbi:hypothetical protein IWQ60_003736, partial [Tieghemiomyces parasiticus]
GDSGPRKGRRSGFASTLRVNTQDRPRRSQAPGGLRSPMSSSASNGTASSVGGPSPPHSPTFAAPPVPTVSLQRQYISPLASLTRATTEPLVHVQASTTTTSSLPLVSAASTAHSDPISTSSAPQTPPTLAASVSSTTSPHLPIPSRATQTAPSSEPAFRPPPVMSTPPSAPTTSAVSTLPRPPRAHTEPMPSTRLHATMPRTNPSVRAELTTSQFLGDLLGGWDSGGGDCSSPLASSSADRSSPLPQPSATTTLATVPPTAPASSSPPQGSSLNEFERWALTVENGKQRQTPAGLPTPPSLASTSSTSSSPRLPPLTGGPGGRIVSRLTSAIPTTLDPKAPVRTQSSVLAAMQNRQVVPSTDSLPLAALAPVAPPRPLLSFDTTSDSARPSGSSMALSRVTSEPTDDESTRRSSRSSMSKPKAPGWLGGILGKGGRKHRTAMADVAPPPEPVLKLDLGSDEPLTDLVSDVFAVRPPSIAEEDDIDNALLDPTSALSKFLAINANPLTSGGTSFRELPSGQMQAISALTELMQQAGQNVPPPPVSGKKGRRAVATSDVEDSETSESESDCSYTSSSGSEYTTDSDDSYDEEASARRRRRLRKANAAKDPKKSKGVSWQLPDEEARRAKRDTEASKAKPPLDDAKLRDQERQRALLQRMLGRHRNEIQQGHGAIHTWMVNCGINPEAVLRDTANQRPAKETSAAPAPAPARPVQRFTAHSNLSGPNLSQLNGGYGPYAGLGSRGYTAHPVPPVPYTAHPSHWTPNGAALMTPVPPPRAATSHGFYHHPQEALSSPAFAPPAPGSSSGGSSVRGSHTHVSPFISRPGTPVLHPAYPVPPLPTIHSSSRLASPEPILAAAPVSSPATDVMSVEIHQPADAPEAVSSAKPSETPESHVKAQAAETKADTNATVEESEYTKDAEETYPVVPPPEKVDDTDSSDSYTLDSDASESERRYVSFRKKASHLTRPIAIETEESAATRSSEDSSGGATPGSNGGRRRFKTNFKPNAKRDLKAVYANTFNAVGTPIALPKLILARRQQEKEEEERLRQMEATIAALASSEEEGESGDNDGAEKDGAAKVQMGDADGASRHHDSSSESGTSDSSDEDDSDSDASSHRHRRRRSHRGRCRRSYRKSRSGRHRRRDSSDEDDTDSTSDSAGRSSSDDDDRSSGEEDVATNHHAGPPFAAAGQPQVYYGYPSYPHSGFYPGYMPYAAPPPNAAAAAAGGGLMASPMGYYMYPPNCYPYSVPPNPQAPAAAATAPTASKPLTPPSAPATSIQRNPRTKATSPTPPTAPISKPSRLNRLFSKPKPPAQPVPSPPTTPSEATPSTVPQSTAGMMVSMAAMPTFYQPYPGGYMYATPPGTNSTTAGMMLASPPGTPALGQTMLYAPPPSSGHPTTGTSSMASGAIMTSMPLSSANYAFSSLPPPSPRSPAVMSHGHSDTTSHSAASNSYAPPPPPSSTPGGRSPAMAITAPSSYLASLHASQTTGSAYGGMTKGLPNALGVQMAHPSSAYYHQYQHHQHPQQHPVASSATYAYASSPYGQIPPHNRGNQYPPTTSLAGGSHQPSRSS